MNLTRIHLVRRVDPRIADLATADQILARARLNTIDPIRVNVSTVRPPRGAVQLQRG